MACPQSQTIIHTVLKQIYAQTPPFARADVHHVSEHQKTLLCGTKCTCNAQLSNLCVECYNIMIINTIMINIIMINIIMINIIMINIIMININIVNIIIIIIIIIIINPKPLNPKLLEFSLNTKVNGGGDLMIP